MDPEQFKELIETIEANTLTLKLMLAVIAILFANCFIFLRPK